MLDLEALKKEMDLWPVSDMDLLRQMKDTHMNGAPIETWVIEKLKYTDIFSPEGLVNEKGHAALKILRDEQI